jgi:DNA-directed RNA polymerase sigma subunit (sigma70/sigma32)
MYRVADCVFLMFWYSTELKPNEQVEISLLRQCLENAMATELSPHERDVLRLRHGLDDGVSRSVREVVEICGGTLSVSDVRTTEMRAFRKLRSPYSVHTFHLLGFLDYVGADIKTVKMKR